MKKLLIIEDDTDIGDMLDINLRDEGYSVDIATDGLTGMKRLQAQSYDLLVLDLMLPGLDGLEICRQVRQMPHYQPIIIISAKSAEMQRVLGLELGADDYLSKPFSVPELIARIRALFRRIDALQRELQNQTGVLVCDDLRIDPVAHDVKLGGQTITLTAKEFELLLFFAKQPGKVFTRMALLDQVWGYSHDGYEHTVNSHINRLRSKIERNSAKPQFIQTVWGVGYKFTENGKE
ncbi:response regulator transcription factor [Methylovulum psychrotolerans]|uniref:response regulator transcription factor n=1 Tax=Methylovulum psychrotolerans TaxID=1704499 RepID=UPI001BFEF882|nr:response regulator transcription factor [Methylovulum psychrotolerans]MBT9099743.1 response regulator transcription factor [Methylovulum psychrotolerans]